MSGGGREPARKRAKKEVRFSLPRESDPISELGIFSVDQ